MNTNQNIGGQMDSSPNQNMGERQTNNNNPVKKMPNPSNYKIVKCKNFEMGN